MDLLRLIFTPIKDIYDDIMGGRCNSFTSPDASIKLLEGQEMPKPLVARTATDHQIDIESVPITVRIDGYVQDIDEFIASPRIRRHSSMERGLSRPFRDIRHADTRRPGMVFLEL